MSQSLPIPSNLPTWGNAVTRGVGRFFLQLLGWRIEGEIPNLAKMVLVAAPHTSNWDWPIGMFAILAVGVKVHWLGKKEFVNSRFRPILTRLGGIPVDREAKHGVVAQTAVQFQQRDQFLLALAPEGTRSMVTRWKRGFYYIAKAADVPIVPAALDYGRKVVLLGTPINPNQEMRDVLLTLFHFYDGVKGKNPQLGATSLRQIVGD